MNLELQGAVVSAPLLNFSPGNLSLVLQMETEGFVLLPNSAREPVFRLGVVRFRALANAVPFSCMLFSPSPPCWFLTSQLKHGFLREAFHDFSYPQPILPLAIDFQIRPLSPWTQESNCPHRHWAGLHLDSVIPHDFSSQCLLLSYLCRYLQIYLFDVCSSQSQDHSGEEDIWVFVLWVLLCL
jgi:hypothetical protein